MLRTLANISIIILTICSSILLTAQASGVGFVSTSSVKVIIPELASLVDGVGQTLPTSVSTFTPYFYIRRLI